MKIAIMQPTFLPWIGYFQIIKNVNIFIFLDDVQFDKRSWQQRNTINNKGRELIITVPIMTKGKYNQNINQAKINNNENWKIKHLKTFKNLYSKNIYFAEIYSLLTEIYDKEINNLSDLNIQLIFKIMNYLGIKTKFFLSSSLDANGRKNEKLINLIKRVGGEKYLTPPGSVDYLDIEKFKSNNIEVETINYNLKNYYLQNEVFLSHLSILDLLFRQGRESINFI